MILESRPLTRDDLSCLTESRPGPNRVKRIRDSHHRVARLVAAGLRMEDVAERSGYAYNYVAYVLAVDPAFQELVATYRGKVDDAYIKSIDDFYGVATSNMLKAETMLADKLDEAIESGETLPTRDLIAISRDAADRFGYGKKSLNVNLNANMGTALERAIARSGKGSVLDAKVVERQPPAISAPRPAAPASTSTTSAQAPQAPIRSSSVVEQTAVNRQVAGSSPASGATSLGASLRARALRRSA